MTHSPRLLDLTRLISRVGRPDTGVDRVERAYLHRFLADDVPLFGLVRTLPGYVLLDRESVAKIALRLDGERQWGSADLLGLFSYRNHRLRGRAEADLRRFSMGRARPSGLDKFLRTHIPRGCAYYNLGHSNLTDRTLIGVKASGATLHIFLHDAIPLDYPQYQTPESVQRFSGLLRRVTAQADQIIVNSKITMEDVLHHAPETQGEFVVAHLGADLPPPSTPPVVLPQPYVVCVGTIEPRKNHKFLLDLWEDMTRSGVTKPHLVLCGARGWRNEDVFARLDTLAAEGGDVTELAGLDDGQLSAVIAGAVGMVFPSLAEGYGLPPVEAAAMGVPVLCNDLPVLREVLGNIPIYASLSDRYLWQKTIEAWAEQHKNGPGSGSQGGKEFSPPTWDAHFNAVLSSP